MNEEPGPYVPRDETAFIKEVGAPSCAELKAKHRTSRSIWFGLGMSGLVGWSVTVPTLIGIALGVWIDRHQPSKYSWTLMLMLVGLVIGCLNAWHWVSKQLKALRDEQEDFHE